MSTVKGREQGCASSPLWTLPWFILAKTRRQKTRFLRLINSLITINNLRLFGGFVKPPTARVRKIGCISIPPLLHKHTPLSNYFYRVGFTELVLQVLLSILISFFACPALFLLGFFSVLCPSGFSFKSPCLVGIFRWLVEADVGVYEGLVVEIN